MSESWSFFSLYTTIREYLVRKMPKLVRPKHLSSSTANILCHLGLMLRPVFSSENKKIVSDVTYSFVILLR